MFTVLALDTRAVTAEPFAVTADPFLEFNARVTRLEQLLNDQGLSAVLLEMQRLQQEVRELRGQLEQHQYQLDQLHRQLNGGDNGDDADNDNAPVLPQLPDASDLDFTPQFDDDPAGLEDAAPIDSPDDSAANEEREAYRAAFDLLKERRYDAAKAAFIALLERYPAGQFDDKTRYWLGDIGYITHDYASAVREFNRLVSAHPRSPKAASALLKMGYIFSEQRDQASARMALEQLMAQFPNTPEARLAAGRLRDLGRFGADH
ncbi:tol-pal system protein YbgF [Rhodopseudomonas palustris]|nr:tol-pal system protein YbgF [Rhodopseudomonas palustris]